MSVRHIAGVLELALPPNLKLVALVYANSANDEDGVVFLSVRRVAERSGYSERQVVTLTRALRRAEVLEPVPIDSLPPQAMERLRGIPKNRWPSVYRLHYSGVQLLRPKPGVKSRRSRGEISDISGVKLTAPESEVREPEAKPWTRELRYPIPEGWEPEPEPHRWSSRRPIPGGFAIVVTDLLWEAVVEVCSLDTSSMPTSSRKFLNRSVEELRSAGADPVEVHARARRYLSGDAPSIPKGSKLTHRALVLHWPALGVPDVNPATREPAVCPPHRLEDTVDPQLGRYCVRCKTWTPIEPTEETQ